MSFDRSGEGRERLSSALVTDVSITFVLVIIRVIKPVDFSLSYARLTMDKTFRKTIIQLNTKKECMPLRGASPFS